MTIAAVLQGKGSAVETIAADASLFDAVRRLGEKRIGALAGRRGRPDRRHHVGARRHLLPARPRPRGARLAGQPSDELAGDHRRFGRPTCSTRWRS